MDRNFMCFIVLVLFGLGLNPGCTDPPVDSLSDIENRPTTGIQAFSDTFNDINTLLDLFLEDASRWTNVQVSVHSTNDPITLEDTRIFYESNGIYLETKPVFTPPYSLQFTVQPTEDAVSKAYLERDGLFFEMGDTLWVSFYVFIPSGTVTQNVAVLDIESTMYENAPGRQIQFGGGDTELILESKEEFHGPSYRQNPETAVDFPKAEWVRLLVRLDLAADENGRSRIWQNATLVIDAQGPNMATPETVYDRIQIGLTANESDDLQTVYIDDVVVSTEQPVFEGK
jgi:hypothetical protein